MDLTDKQKRSKKGNVIFLSRLHPVTRQRPHQRSVPLQKRSPRTVEMTLPLKEIQEKHLVVLPDTKTNDRKTKMAAIVVQTRVEKKTECINHCHPFPVLY